MDLMRVREAPERLGVSSPTLKQWIYRRKGRTVKTVGGHHRGAQSGIYRPVVPGGRGREPPQRSEPSASATT